MLRNNTKVLPFAISTLFSYHKFFITMRGLILIFCTLFVFGIINTLPYPLRQVRNSIPAISANYIDTPPAIRAARAVEESKKDDLEGSETAAVVVPYVGWPYYYGYHVPVVYAGK